MSNIISTMSKIIVTAALRNTVCLSGTLFLLSSCAEIVSTIQNVQTNSALAQIRQMSRADLENALHKADPSWGTHPATTIDLTAPDPQGAMCWAALLPVTGNYNGQVGAATLLEDARLAALAVHGSCAGIIGTIVGAPLPVVP